MDKFVQTELEGAGVNVEETLRRFMNNEMLMIKFLRKFVDDENMNKLRTLIADKHYNEVTACSAYAERRQWKSWSY